MIIATKGGVLWHEDGSGIFFTLTADSIRREVEASLRRLHVDHIDLYQIHWPNPDEDIEGAWGAIAELIQAGTIRYGGVSNFSVAQIKRVQQIHPVASLQPPYSLLVRDAEAELLPYCAANTIGVIAYSPMQAGLLTGTFTQERVAQLPDDDWRKGNSLFQEPQLSANLALVEGLRQIAARHGRPLAQLAIAWVLRRPEVTAAIVGGRRPAQVAEFSQALEWQLDAADLAEIEALLAQHQQRLTANEHVAQHG